MYKVLIDGTNIQSVFKNVQLALNSARSGMTGVYPQYPLENCSQYRQMFSKALLLYFSALLLVSQLDK